MKVKQTPHEIIYLSEVIAEIKSQLPEAYSLQCRIDNYILLKSVVAKHSQSMCSKCRALVRINLALLYKQALADIHQN